MRTLTIAVLLLSSLFARSEGAPGLSDFAQEYWSAILSKDPKKIFALYDPKVFSDLSPAEAEFMKEQWMKSYSDTAEQQGDSFEITTKKLAADANPFPTWRWAVKPEFQIEIQTFKKVSGGREGLTGEMDMVVQRGDRFFIVRPVPPEAELRKHLQTK